MCGFVFKCEINFRFSVEFCVSVLNMCGMFVVMVMGIGIVDCGLR